MWKKLFSGAAVALLAFAIPAMATQKVVRKADLPVSTANGAAWYSTGIGADARDIVVKGFPLKLVFATKKGELLAGVDVRLTRGGESAYEMKNVGPWLFVDVPAGTYDLRAKVNGREVVRKGVRVPAKGAPGPPRPPRPPGHRGLRTRDPLSGRILKRKRGEEPGRRLRRRRKPGEGGRTRLVEFPPSRPSSPFLPRRRRPDQPHRS
ncbi:MAG: hypothetical protein ACE5IM_02900 [Nitrospinota bacterium]